MDLNTDYGKELYKFFNEKNEIYDLENFELRIQLLTALKGGQIEQQVSDANGGCWQKCPKCDGQGIVSKPPWIAGDQDTWTASQANFTCNLCNGQMVIKQ
ncbi:MAG: hypothetical protein M0R03_17200 [Novosphingobium sp.]|nr:hypothetical protein [Novosphingobium sp.]